MNLYSTILISLIGLISQILILKYVVVKKIRINNGQFKLLYSTLKEDKGLKFIINEECTHDSNILPKVFCGIFRTKQVPIIYLNLDERINQAGWSSTTSICEIIIFRWKYEKLINIICKSHDLDTKIVNISINNHWLGELETDTNIEIDECYREIEDDLCLINEGKLFKTSVLLYGSPGNGKTSLVRDLAKKYGWNIHYLDITSDMKNENLLSLPASVPNKTLILMEDFDSVFDKRENIKFKNNTEIQFSFDAILNMLDGIFKGKNKVVFIMTANDISKIDSAIVNRRSRMKHKILVDNPSYKKILSITKNLELTKMLIGSSLDNVYNTYDYHELYGKEKTIEKFFKNITVEDIKHQEKCLQ